MARWAAAMASSSVTLWVSLIPVLLGGRIPLLPSTAARATLKLRKHRIYEKTGTVGLEYGIEQP
jgi:hypothetical protein